MEKDLDLFKLQPVEQCDVRCDKTAEDCVFGKLVMRVNDSNHGPLNASETKTVFDAATHCVQLSNWILLAHQVAPLSEEL